MLNSNLHITDDLLVKNMLGEALPEEQLFVQAWLEESEGNRKYYQQFMTIWEESKALEPALPVDLTVAWNKLNQRISSNQQKPVSTGKVIRGTFTRWMQVAAAVLITGAGIWLVYTNRELPAAITTFQTHANITVDTLPDGSVITMNKNTTITYEASFKGKQRNLRLKGEAFFNVQPDKTKPFIINADDVSITVVGTAFNVKNYDSVTEVIVENGIVKVGYNNQVIELYKGEKTVIKNTGGTLEKTKITDSLYNYYRTKSIVCNDTPLSEVIAAINEAYNAKVVLGDEALNHLLLSATFNNEDLETIISIIQQTFNLQVERKGNSIILYSN